MNEPKNYKLAVITAIDTTLGDWVFQVAANLAEGPALTEGAITALAMTTVANRFFVFIIRSP